MSKTRIVYINSFQNSGSTILGVMLGSHAQIEYVGESMNFQVNVLGKKLCSCGQDYRSCPVWSRVLGNIGTPIDKFPTKVGKLTRVHQLLQLLLLFNISSDHPLFSRGFNLFSAERSMVKNIRRLNETVADLTRCKIVCDSSHRSSLAKQLYLSHPPESFRIIHLIRDGRGVTNSVIRKELDSRSSVERDWRNYTVYALLTQKSIPPQYSLRIRYEDLCQNPRTTLSKISDFLELPDWEHVPSPERDSYHFIGGSRTLKSRDSWKLYVDERWRTELAQQDLKTFEQKAGWLNRALGYN